MTAMIVRHCKVLVIVAALVVIGFPVASKNTSAQQVSIIHKEADATALRALQNTLGVIRQTKEFQLMGLKSTDESKEATLGVPMPIKEIGYNKLLAYQEGWKLENVIVGPEQILYPVVVRNQVRSSLTLVKKEERWEMTSYGDTGLATEIYKTKASLQKEIDVERAAQASYSLVVVPAFQFYMVALTQNGKTLLKAVNPTAAEELGLTGVMKEREVIAELSAYTKAFDAQYGEAIRQRRLVN